MKRTLIRPGLISSVILWTVTLGLLVHFVVSPAVLAADVEGGNADGETSCNGGCDADVTLNLLPSVVDVDNGDTLQFIFYTDWEDTRSSPQVDAAHHHFYVTATYSGNTYTDSLDRYTYGQQTGHKTLSADIPNVQENTQVTNIEWYASITIAGTCFESDSEGPYWISLS